MIKLPFVQLDLIFFSANDEPQPQSTGHLSVHNVSQHANDEKNKNKNKNANINTNYNNSNTNHKYRYSKNNNNKNNDNDWSKTAADVYKHFHVMVAMTPLLNINLKVKNPLPKHVNELV